MILIVDDKRENILPIEKILSLHGLESDSAESGEEALKKILKYDYSLIIMDVQMPGMDGFEVVETLAGSNRTKDIPVIFLSAVSVEKKFISRGYESGGVDYIIKPADPDLLILKVKTFLRLYGQHNELKAIRDLLSQEIEIRRHDQLSLEEKVQQRTSELTRKNEELEMRNHELQQFTWVVSHDLKEPLRKIEIFSRMIRDRYLTDPTALGYMDRTIHSAERMSRLISDLLEYSRLSSEIHHQQTDLNVVLREVLVDLDYVIEEKKAIISYEDLPTIYGVPSQLRQVFQNLIGNSIKFAREGHPPEISVQSSFIATRDAEAPAVDDGDFCRITVTDNGIGFDETFLDKIFVIFQSLNGREEYEGTGIGLAIAKKIVDKHGGMITARSKPGQGATFILVLPVAKNIEK